ncbi:uncharacterized protein [Drosophila pseudoobscura]|uniref:Retrotransposon gag domain-containing protein n=1 Tax=Drosophila pseudoobscura pseudoobscura TaxID=46245 RepID=A0A6I8VSZ9_DROPS|nr:uncharacterized protein LOC117183662 [Drosophila pseudoobscura]
MNYADIRAKTKSELSDILRRQNVYFDQDANIHQLRTAVKKIMEDTHELGNTAPSADETMQADIFAVPVEREIDRDNRSAQHAVKAAPEEYGENVQKAREAFMPRQDNACSKLTMRSDEYEEESRRLQQLEQLYVSRKRLADLKLSILKTEKEAMELETPRDCIDLTHIEALIRPFSGDDDQAVTSWISNFEDIMNFHGVSESKCWILAKQLLGGSAKAYIDHVAPLTWQLMRAELLNVFEQTVTAWDIGKRLEARKIANNESALQYFVAMCSIASQADKATSVVVKFIVEGLQDKTGMTASMLYCSTLNELRDKMVTYDKVRRAPGVPATYIRSARNERWPLG